MIVQGFRYNFRGLCKKHLIEVEMFCVYMKMFIIWLFQAKLTL